jgi:hypothetical protein
VRQRWEARYTLNNVPTNQQLVVRVAGPNGQSDQSWIQTVSWNVYLSANARACTGPNDNNCLNGNTYQLDVDVFSRAAYSLIPREAGLSGGVTPGMGAIFGEVRDCNDVRVRNAAVGTSSPADRLSYFRGAPIQTIPDPALLATEALGQYALLNLRPGAASVLAAGLVNDTLTSFGSFDAFVYPNTVSLVNLNSGHPR